MASDPSAREVLERILGALNAARVPYMLTGSFASALHGAPRTTQVAGIVRMQGDALDTSYVERWVAVLDLAEQWMRAKSMAV